MKIEVAVGGEEFWARLRADIRAAGESVRVQTLSWEGDPAGLPLADEMGASPAPDRRVLVDAYSRYVVSDRFLYTPRALLDPALRAEARRTREMAVRLGARGAGVRFTNPPGFLLHRFAARNHKKMAVVDRRVAYLGGINFSEHNFAWHDLMLRFEDEALGAFLADDFDATWAGVDQARSATFGPVEVHLLNGRASGDSFAAIFRALDAAQHEIHVHSPYLAFPFVDRLAEARRRGVRVRIVTPAWNNYPVVQDYLLWKAMATGLEVWLYPERMMHLKAMLIDDRVLIVGSANFDWPSFRLYQEVVALVREPEAIRAFRARVLEPDLAASSRLGGPPRALRGRIAEAKLRVGFRILGLATRLRREGRADRG